MAHAVTYARRLGLFSGTMAVVGGIIGGGIFRTPATVAERVGSAGLVLLAWVAGGVVALIGAFCFGELGRRRPRAGGGYVYGALRGSRCSHHPTSPRPRGSWGCGVVGKAHRRRHRDLDLRFLEPRDPGDAAGASGDGRGRRVALSGTFGQPVDYVTFGDWIFFGLTAAGLFVYRAREARGAAPAAGFRVPGYPWTPALFVLAAAYVVASAVASNPQNALIGAGLIAAGVPVFLLWARRRLSSPPRR